MRGDNMDTQKILTIAVIVLLAVIAAEGAVILTKGTSSEQVTDDSYEMLKDKIDLLNANGGKIQFSNSHFNEIPKGSNLVTLKGEILFIAAHTGYSEEVASVSSIAFITINK